MNRQNTTVVKLAETAILAALCYVVFTFLQIKIPVPGGDATSIHLGNAFCVLGALLLGGWYGGIAGAVGMTIADIMDPVYITVAPKTFVLKLCIGLITGLVAHRIAKINESTDRKYVFKWSIIASAAGLAFNVVADPLVGYFYKQFILGQPQQMAEVLAKMSAFATLFNGVISVILVGFLYNAVRPALIKMQILTIRPREAHHV
ncbi:MAG TPA: ECF transporter S component [Candidatus Blautia faecigallinarum]|uniref:ECF transporter S component n=1 Tax=Candidatus Blautia faecigallinarum TaxID=2838488 RepID=A0A9D2DUZ7_9FIRM|nr:ECF transporter S component [Candidatus Blautia faecigallinarum]